MRFSVKSNLYGRWGIHVELGEYDAVPPTNNVAFEATPFKINPEVEAVALTLLFGRFSGGEMEFAHKVGPNTAKAIQRYLEPTMGFITPIEYYPKPLPLGTETIRVDESSDFSIGESSFMSLRADHFNGAIKTHTSMAVANNSFTLKQDKLDIRPTLACALLFAEDLEASCFEVPNHSIANFDQVQKLLSAARINLEQVG